MFSLSQEIFGIKIKEVSSIMFLMIRSFNAMTHCIFVVVCFRWSPLTRGMKMSNILIFTTVQVNSLLHNLKSSFPGDVGFANKPLENSIQLFDNYIQLFDIIIFRKIYGFLLLGFIRKTVRETRWSLDGPCFR